MAASGSGSSVVLPPGAAARPTQEELLVAFQELAKRLESGEALGKNEDDEEFVEIQETLAEAEQRIALLASQAASSQRQEEEEQEEEGVYEDEEDFDYEAFESLMEEMEHLDLPLPLPPLPSSSSGAAKGLKRGFLLSGSGISGEEGGAGSNGESQAAAAAHKAGARGSTRTAEAVPPPRMAAFSGQVVERSVGERQEERQEQLREARCSAARETAAAAEVLSLYGGRSPASIQQAGAAAPRVSQFKQRMRS